MAFIQEEKKDDLTTSSTQATPIVGSGGIGVKATPKQGSGATANINKYVNANKSQVGDLAQGISNKISKDAQNVNTGLTAAQSNFQNDTSSEKNRLDAGEGFINNSLASAQQGQRLASPELAKYTQFRQNTGPDLDVNSDIANLQQKASKAEGLTSQTQNASGRQQLLANVYATPTYSTGQKRLDQLLLQSTPGATRDLITQSKAATTGLAGKVDTELGAERSFLSDIDSKRAALQFLAGSQADKQTSDLQTELSNLLSGRQTAREAQVTDAKAAVDKALAEGRYGDISGIIKGISGQNIDTSNLVNRDAFTRGLTQFWKGQFLGGMGKDVDAYMGMQKEMFNPYLANAESLNLNSSVTDSERAKYQALADLAGITSSERSLTENAVNPGLAGAFNADASKRMAENAAAIKAKVLNQLATTKTTYQNPEEVALQNALGVLWRNSPQMAEELQSLGLSGGENAETVKKQLEEHAAVRKQ